MLSRGVNTGVGSLVDALAEGYNERQRALAEATAQPVAPTPAASQPEFELELELLDGEAQGPAPAPAQQAEAATLALEFDPEPASAAPTPAPAARMDAEAARQVLTARLLCRDVDPDLPGAELTEAEVVELATPAIHRLGRQLDRTFHHFSELQGGATVEHMCFSGGLCSSRVLLDALARDLGIPADLLDPLAIGPRPGPDVALPQSQADRLALSLVAGLALSDGRITPNLLHTYKEKDRELRTVRQGNAVYAAFLALVLVLTGVWFWQGGEVRGRQAELDALHARIATFSPVVDQTLLLHMAGDLGVRQRRLKDLSCRYEGLALFNEVSALLPEAVLLRSVGVELPAPAKVPANGAAPAPAPAAAGFVILDGQVAGDPEMFDARLAAFLIRLEGSPLFEGAVIHERQTLRPASGGEVLRFVVHVRVRKGGAA